MREFQGRNGTTYYAMTRHELEALPGFRPETGGRKARACCPIHNGDNPTALAIDWERGWAYCFKCDEAIWVDDGTDHRYRTAYAQPTQRAYAPVKRSTAPQRAEALQPDRSDLYIRLRAAVDRAVAALPDSPGAAYLAGRGIPLDVVQGAGVGWGTRGKLAGRVVFPLTLPDGIATSATGRAIDDHTKPKYRALAAREGYLKTLFNGGVIGVAVAQRAPVVVVEGPIDALACIAGGVPLTVATCGTAYAHPEHFAGISRALIAFDADAAGEDALTRWVGMLAGVGVATDFLPVGVLGKAKDLGEYWQWHGRLPDAIAGYPSWAASQVTYTALSAEMRVYADALATSLIADGPDAIIAMVADLPRADHSDHLAMRYAIDQARQALKKRQNASEPDELPSRDAGMSCARRSTCFPTNVE